MKSGSRSVSACEKDFVLQCVRTRKRLDGRETYDFRKIQITFGVDRGHCDVQLGKTRVLAQVSCEIATPKASRPTEGQMYINLELSPMASPAFESGRMSEYGVELNRSLERFFVESRAIDMESLCIVAGEKVWSVRVDVHVLDHGGNILDCASVAAITALAHFRRPDVSVAGEEVTVHSAEDRAPVPLGLHHMPVCVTFAFFDEGKFLLVDPTEKEECVMNGSMTMAMNIHREICGAVMGGGVSLETEQIIRCSKIATVKVTEILELVQQALAKDTQKRTPGQTVVEPCETVKRITRTACEPTQVDLTTVEEKATEEPMESCHAKTSILDDAYMQPLNKPYDLETVEKLKPVVTTPITEAVRKQFSQSEAKGPGTAEIGEGRSNMWIVVDDEDGSEYVDAMEVEESRVKDRKSESKPSPEIYTIESDESEEEEVVILTPSKVGEFKKSAAPAKHEQEELDLTMALKKPKQGSGATPAKTTEKRRKRKTKP